MFRIQKIVLIAITLFAFGCSCKSSLDETSLEERIIPPPILQTDNYLTSREKLIESLIPEEQPAAVRILDLMTEFIAENHCKPEEVLISVSEMAAIPENGWPQRTYVDLYVPQEYHSFGISLRLFTIWEKQVHLLNFSVEKYECTTGCCFEVLFPPEYPDGFWQDIGSFTALESMVINDKSLDAEDVADNVRNSKQQ